MANVNRPAGLLPTRHASGGTPQRSGGYTIASGLAQNLFKGDPVTLTGTDRNITIGAAGGPYIGVFAGVKYVDQNGEVQFRPRWPSGQVATEIEAFVYDDPMQEFVVQADNGGGAIAAAQVGLNANLLAGSGNTFTGRSGWQLDTSSAATTATLAAKILGLARIPENDFGDFAKVRVLLNNHLKILGGSGAGV